MEKKTILFIASIILPFLVIVIGITYIIVYRANKNN